MTRMIRHLPRTAFLIGLLVLRLPPGAARAEEPPLDLPTLLRTVADASHAAGAASAELAAARPRVVRGRAAWWPEVDLAGSYTMRDNPPEVRAGAFSFATGQQDNASYDLSVRELLFDGGRRGLAVDLAQRRAEAVRLGGEAAVQQAQLDAVDAYLRILELEGSRRVLVARREALDAHLAVVRDLFAEGLTARNDLLETEVRQRTVGDQLAAVADHLEVARRDLNRQLGRSPGAGLALPDSLPPAPALGPEPGALAEGARESNLSLQATRARTEAVRTALELSKRAWLPSVFVGLDHAYVENEHLVHEFVNSVSAGVRWNLFDGGGRRADVARAEAETVLAERDHLETARAVDVAVERAWRGWERARRELATARTDVAASRENLRLVADQYREGLARSSDVLDAETMLAGSRYDAVRRHYDTYRAQAELLAAAGRDLAAFYAAPSAAESGVTP